MRYVLLLLAFAAVAPAWAQVTEEPDFEGAVEGEDGNAPAAWRPFGEALLRGDRVTGLPAGREDLERAKLRLRWGGVWNPDRHDRLSFGVAGEGAIATGANKDNLANNDVEEADAITLDQLWIRWRGGDRFWLELGKAPLPLELSPLLWDGDLRPTGGSLRTWGTLGDFNRWQLDLGVFTPNPLEETGAKLLAAQFGWHWREGAPFSGGALLSYLDYSDLDELERARLGRGNSLSAGRYVNDYRLIDAQFYVRGVVHEKPLEGRLDLVRNLDAERDRNGVRASLIYGDRFNQPGWELGWAWQRIQRDAVLAAVNADDWWFHTAARGHMPWIGYGFGRIWSVRLAAFFETRDGLDERTKRLLLDVEARW